jgi:hypothetical protein
MQHQEDFTDFEYECPFCVEGELKYIPKMELYKCPHCGRYIELDILREYVLESITDAKMDFSYQMSRDLNS